MTSKSLRHNCHKRKPFKWAALPTRKPLAVGAALFIACIVLYHTVAGTDVPQGTAGLLEAMLYVCVGGYAATSAYEAVRPSYGTPHYQEREEPEEK